MSLNSWTALSISEAASWDTPALTAERSKIVKEIADIETARENIDKRMAVVESADLASLSVEQINAAREAKEDRFRLLQRELSFRQGPLDVFLRLVHDTADEADKQHEALKPELEAKLAADFERIGYLPRTESSDPHRRIGTWNTGMILNHPAMVSYRVKADQIRHVRSNHKPRTDNREMIETLKTSLSAAMRQLVA